MPLTGAESLLQVGRVRYDRLEIGESLASQLRGKTVIEFPTLAVLVPSEVSAYCCSTDDEARGAGPPEARLPVLLRNMMLPAECINAELVVHCGGLVQAPKKAAQLQSPVRVVRLDQKRQALTRKRMTPCRREGAGQGGQLSLTPHSNITSVCARHCAVRCSSHFRAWQTS